MQMNDRFSSSQKEIEDAFEALNQAIENHLKWYVQLHEGLICGQPFPETVTHLLAHTKCQLGHWYYNEACENIRDDAQFSHLEALHKSMHDSARELVVVYLSHQKVELDTYRKLCVKQQALMELLTNFRDRIISRQHSFDPMTGLINRRSIDLLLEKNHAHSMRTNEPYVVAMLDIDFFKSINDTHGHLAGDQVLITLSPFLNSHLRDLDSIGRYGGEEFLILLPDTTVTQAFEVLERLRNGVEGLGIEYDDIILNVTVSIGLTEFDNNKTFPELLKRADDALYLAKKSGRNQVKIYSAN